MAGIPLHLCRSRKSILSSYKMNRESAKSTCECNTKCNSSEIKFRVWILHLGMHGKTILEKVRRSEHDNFRLLTVMNWSHMWCMLVTDRSATWQKPQYKFNDQCWIIEYRVAHQYKYAKLIMAINGIIITRSVISNHVVHWQDYQ